MSRERATFGQLSLWRSIAKLPPAACNLPQIWALPRDAAKEEIEHALEDLERRHESLRTCYEERGEHGLTQVVQDPAAVSLETVEADAAQVAEELAAEPFDLSADRPWRARLVTARQVPSQLVICYHHIAVDAWAINQLHEEFLALLAGRPLPEDAPNCRELAVEQWSDARKNRRASARRYWREIFLAAPPMARDTGPSPVTSRWARHSSQEAAAAAHRLAKRLNVSVPSVLVAAYCMALARQSGERKLLVAVYANNRSDPRWERLVAAQTQIIPLLVAVDPDEEFGAFATRVHWESLRSYKHAAYNVDDVFEEGALHGYHGTVNGSFEGSVSGFFRYFFNYLGEYQKDQTIPRREMESGTAGRNIGAPLYLQAQDGDTLTCTLRENSTSTGFDGVIGLLRALEDVLVLADADAEPAEES
ncbi:condensation domain-containing protein [Actinocrinis puniceicyclus]|uniref:condensation domain-containing protein n=1 Tax=Actinocrinis puniceicyclus TaxID=977794 RepID=UPI001B8C30BB|nr:condensation domain-containing protein [Actinocrinis puniceicyclus]